MSLPGYLEVNRLETVPDSPALARAKLALARTRLADASVGSVSEETRFECACTAIREVAEVGLLLHGCRTSKACLGHHMTAIDCLEATLGVGQSTVRVLDRLRQQRNRSGYDADPVTDGEFAECVRQAARLVPLGEQALKAKGWA